MRKKQDSVRLARKKRKTPRLGGGNPSRQSPTGITYQQRKKPIHRLPDGSLRIPLGGREEEEEPRCGGEGGGAGARRIRRRKWRRVRRALRLEARVSGCRVEIPLSRSRLLPSSPGLLLLQFPKQSALPSVATGYWAFVPAAFLPRRGSTVVAGLPSLAAAPAASSGPAVVPRRRLAPSTVQAKAPSPLPVAYGSAAGFAGLRWRSAGLVCCSSH